MTNIDIKKFKGTKALKKHLKCKKKIVISQGSSRSGKSTSLCQIMIMKALEKERRITIVMEFFPILRLTLIRDILIMLKDLGLKQGTMKGSIYKFNKQHNTISFRNGSLIEFRAFNNDPERALAGSRDILWIDEGDTIPWSVYQQLSIRTTEKIYITYNPRNSESWIFKQILENPSYEGDYDFVHTTIKDNRFAPKHQVEEIMRLAEMDENFRMVYLEGLPGRKVDLIYDKKDYEIIPEIPIHILQNNIQYLGIDFGWEHPLALIECFVVPNKKGHIEAIYCNELYYDSKTSNKQLKQLIRVHSLDKYIAVADNSRPEHIAELKRMGVNIFPCEKGGGSVAYGISLMKSVKWYVTEASKNIIKELRNYSYQKDKNGDWILDKLGNQIPIKVWDDALDAIRYVAKYYVDNVLEKKSARPIPSARKRGLIPY